VTDSPKPIVLVVDDEPDILTLNRFILEQAGNQVITAGDGVDAIQKAIDFTPDVIVLDVMMPRMNGYQVCRLLKNDHRTASIPIIICTVKSLESEKLYAYTSGADHYIVKPFEKDRLVELVNKCLEDNPVRHERSLNEGGIPRSLTSTDSILSDVNRLLDRRLMELTILQDLTQTMTSTLDLDSLLRVIQRNLRDLGFPTGRILLLKDDGHLEERVTDETPLSVNIREHTLFDKVLTDNEVAILKAEKFYQESPGDFQRIFHAPTVVLVPIQAGGKPIGMLLVENTPGQPVDRNQTQFLLTLASQAGLAIENANLYERTRQLSITDGLTEIYNYRYFRERLDSELARAKRYSNTLGLLIIDIDHFKRFNDEHGHLLGDEVLRNVASIIKANTRDIDIVARYGGEEFGVILNEIEMEEIMIYAERIREAVEDFGLALPDERKIGVTVSLGVAVCRKGEVESQEFIRRSDQALYRAKETGRNRICVWKEEGDHLCAAKEKNEKS
jgi:diguanylate cyclase (GGDEF)-like protein